MSSKNNIQKAQSTPGGIKVMYWSVSSRLNRWNLPQGMKKNQVITWAICGQWYLNTLALQAAQNEKAQVDASLEKDTE